MSFMQSIVSRIQDIADYFYDAYLEVFDWIYPFNLLAPPLYYICYGFSYLAYYFDQFSDWVDFAASRISDILDWSTIWSFILSYVPNLSAISNWFNSWKDFIWQEVITWWQYKKEQVESWIDVAKDTLQYQLDYLSIRVDSIQSRISDIVSMIPSATDILTSAQALIDGAFLSRQDFWQGWQDFRSQVTDFFSDPEDWLYKAIDRIIERFW